MSKARRAFILLALGALVVAGASLIRQWFPPAITANAQSVQSDTLFFVGGPQESIQRIAAGESARLVQPVPAAEGIQVASGTCGVSGLHASPNGRWVAVVVGCETSVHTLILDTSTDEVRPVETGESLFLNWAPDGDSFLVRVGHLGESTVLLVDAANSGFEQVDTPPFTYDVVFSPDGRRMLYAVTQGLGFGSQVWVMDRDGRSREQIIHDPAHVIVYPRWSPTGDHLAYVRMADSNVPFTVGELVLADANGHDERVVAPADAGHGYPPVWSPDGRLVAFVVRENGKDSMADVSASRLESNVYLVEVESRNVHAATQFAGALTEAPAWSPDGAWLAFRTDVGGGADVWLLEVATGVVQQVTQDANARHPVWVAGNDRR